MAVEGKKIVRTIIKVLWIATLVGLIILLGLLSYQYLAVKKDMMHADAISNGKRATVSLLTGTTEGLRRAEVIKEEEIAPTEEVTEEEGGTTDELEEVTEQELLKNSEKVAQNVHAEEEVKEKTQEHTEVEEVTEEPAPKEEQEVAAPEEEEVEVKAEKPIETEEVVAEQAAEEEAPREEVNKEAVAEETKAPEAVEATKEEPLATPRKDAYISILIPGLGLSTLTTERALKLPHTISLGFSPYTNDLSAWEQKAIDDGHDVLIGVPMEPEDYPISDPGPYALLTTLAENKNLQRLDWILSHTKNHIGVYTNQNEHVTFDSSVITPILQALFEKNLLFLYGSAKENNILPSLAKEAHVPLIMTDVIIDDIITPQNIKGRLDELEIAAHKNGYAMGIGHPYPITLNEIREWIPTLKAKRIRLIPVSQMIRMVNK